MKRDYVAVCHMEYGDALVAHLRFALVEQKRLKALTESRPH